MLRWIINTYRRACAAYDARQAQARYAKLRRLRLGAPNDARLAVAEANAMADMCAAVMRWEGLK